MLIDLLIDLLRLLRDPARAEAFEADPEGFLGAHGLGGCTAAELAEALPLAAATLPDGEGAELLARCGAPEAWAASSPAQVLVRAVSQPTTAPPAPAWADPVPVGPAVGDPGHPVAPVPADEAPDTGDEVPPDDPPRDDPPDEPDAEDEAPDPGDEGQPADEPVDDGAPDDDESEEPVDEPDEPEEPVDEGGDPGEGEEADDGLVAETPPPGAEEPGVDIKEALAAARQAVADGDADALAAAVASVDPAQAEQLLGVIREELRLEGVPDDDPLVGVLDEAATALAVADGDEGGPAGDGPGTGGEDPFPIRRIGGDEEEDVAPDQGGGAPLDPTAEVVAEAEALLRSGDVDGATDLLKQVDLEHQVELFERLDADSGELPPETAQFVSRGLDFFSGFGEGEGAGADGKLDDPTRADPGEPGPPGGTAGGTDFFGDDVLGAEPPGVEPPGPGATVGGTDFFGDDVLGAEPGAPGADAASPGGDGLTPEELAELERISLDAGDDIIGNIGQ